MDRRGIGILAGNVERGGGGQSDNDGDYEQEQIQFSDGVSEDGDGGSEM